MTKIFLTLTLFIIPIAIQCQNITAGTILGINTSQVSGDNLGGFNKIGVNLGGFVIGKFKKFDTQIELKYINKGSREIIDNQTYNEGYRFHISYLEIPLMIKKSLSKKHSIELGWSIAYLVKWEETYNGANEARIELNNTDFSFLMGYNYKLRKNLYLNSRLSNSITPIRPHNSGQIYRWNKGQYNTSISFSILYQIGEKPKK